MTETVILDYEIRTSIDKVWSALTTSDTLSKWMMFKQNTFQPEIGHRFQFSGVEGYDSTVECEITELEPPHRLAYTWEAPGVDGQPHRTLVTWTLTAQDDNLTLLHLEQSGFRPEARQEVGGARHGWQYMLAQLDQLLTADKQ